MVATTTAAASHISYDGPSTPLLEKRTRDRLAWALDRHKSTLDLYRQVGQKLAELRRTVEPKRWKGVVSAKFGISAEQAAGLEEFYQRWRKRAMRTAEVDNVTLVELLEYTAVLQACFAPHVQPPDRGVGTPAAEASSDTADHAGEADAAPQPETPVDDSPMPRQRAKSSSQKTGRRKRSTPTSRKQPCDQPEEDNSTARPTPDQRKTLLRRSPRLFSDVMRRKIGLDEALDMARQESPGSAPTAARPKRPR